MSKHPASPANGSKLLTIGQVAEQCSVHARTVRRWIKSGELRAHRFGQLVRVSEGDLSEFLAAHRDP
jgi:excisionase family DNA binding protein